MKEPSRPPDELRDPEILQLAQRLRASTDPRARAVVPLSEAERHAMAERVLGAEAPLNVVPLRLGGRWSRWAALALAAALAIGLVAVVWVREGVSPRLRVAYELRVEGDKMERGDGPAAGQSVRLRPSTRLAVTLTPKEPARDVALRVLVVRRDKARLVKPMYASDGEGRFTIDNSAREVLGEQENGPAELVFVVGSAMPGDEEVARIAASGAAEPPVGLTVLRRAVQLEDWGGARGIDPKGVEFAGCTAVTAGPVCEVAAGTKLVLWAPMGSTEGRVRIDGGDAPAEVTQVQGGTRWTVVMPEAGRMVELVSSRLASPFQVQLGRALTVPALAQTEQLVVENRLSEAEKKLAEAGGDERPAVELAVLRFRARIARRQGHAEQAEALLRDVIDKAAGFGRLSDEVEGRHLLAYLEIARGHDLDEADTQLTVARAKEGQAAALRAEGDFHRGLLAQEQGRYGLGLASFEAALQAAERLGLSELQSAVLEPLAEVMSVWGRDDEAAGLIERAERMVSGGPCERGRVLTNRAWAEHRAARTALQHERAEGVARDALQALGGMPCGTVLATAWTNLAFVQAAAGRPADARRSLGQAMKEPPGDERLAAWIRRLEMEIALAEEPRKALVLSQRLEEGMKGDAPPELAFEAAFGKAVALDALDRAGDARNAYQEATRRLARWGAQAPLGRGRASFFERQSGAFEAWVDFSVRQAEMASLGPDAREQAMREAARVVQQGLGQFMATLLSSPGGTDPSGAAATPPGIVATSAAAVLFLFFHPVRAGWVGIAIEPSGHASLHRIAGPVRDVRPEAISAALLRPFAAEIERARAIRIFAHRALRDVSFEALPWKEGVLIDHVAVSYGVVLPESASGDVPSAEACRGRPFALLVTDPERNLRGAQRVGESIGKLLDGGAVVLSGSRATKQEMLGALTDPCLRLFQYDGHASFSGTDGLDASIALAGDPLHVREILDASVLARVPETVVLSGCETAKEEGLGVAQALLRRGTRQVLATTKPVDDDLSERLVASMYRADPPVPGAAWDLASAFRAAVRRLRAEHGEAGNWWLFRVLAR